VILQLSPKIQKDFHQGFLFKFFSTWIPWLFIMLSNHSFISLLGLVVKWNFFSFFFQFLFLFLEAHQQTIPNTPKSSLFLKGW
jgi:hypothetical protein